MSKFIEEYFPNDSSDSEDEAPAGRADQSRAGRRHEEPAAGAGRRREERAPPRPTVHDIERVYITPDRAHTQREHDQIDESRQKDNDYQHWLEVYRPEEVDNYNSWKSETIRRAQEKKAAVKMPDVETIFNWVNRDVGANGDLWKIEADQEIEERLVWEREHNFYGPQSLSWKIEEYRKNLINRVMSRGKVTMKELAYYEDSLRNGGDFGLRFSDIDERITIQMELEMIYPEFERQGKLTDYIDTLRQRLAQERQQYNSRGGASKYKKSRKSKKVKKTRKSRKSKK